MSPAFERFRDALGHPFGDPELLARALTHRSFGAQHNERLEFLGDGVLGCVIAEALCRRFPDLPEGRLTAFRSLLVREETLAAVARDLGVPEVLRLGEGEVRSAIEVRPSILADALEAVIGAVFLDGGYPAAQAAVLRIFSARFARLDPDAVAKDAKTRLQEELQARRLPLPEYRVTAVHGEAHRQSFEVECVVAELGLRASGDGSSRRRAEQVAAEAVLGRMKP